MAKWHFDRPGTWVYDSLGIIATQGDILDASNAPDSYWTTADAGLPETVQRFYTAPIPMYVELEDGTPLVWSTTLNRFTPADGPIEGSGGDGADGVGIDSITRTSGDGSAGTTDTYSITLSDSSVYTFTVHNGSNGTNGTNGSNGSAGRGVTSIARSSGDGSAGSTDTYTITYSDATTSTFAVKNGANGTNGTNGTDGQGVPTAGTTAQVLRKVNGTNFNTEWHTLAKADVGLSAVDNTADTDKPISDDTQAALDDLESTKLSSVGSGDLPPATVMYVVYTGSWGARPTSRTDVLVIWIGSDDSDPPTGALTDDLWVKDAA